MGNSPASAFRACLVRSSSDCAGFTPEAAVQFVVSSPHIGLDLLASVEFSQQVGAGRASGAVKHGMTRAGFWDAIHPRSIKPIAMLTGFTGAGTQYGFKKGVR